MSAAYALSLVGELQPSLLFTGFGWSQSLSVWGRSAGRRQANMWSPEHRRARQPISKYRNKEQYGETRNNEERRSMGWKTDRSPDEVYVEQLSLINSNRETEWWNKAKTTTSNWLEETDRMVPADGRRFATCLSVIWRQWRIRPINGCVDGYSTCRRGRKEIYRVCRNGLTATN